MLNIKNADEISGIATLLGIIVMAIGAFTNNINYTIFGGAFFIGHMFALNNNFRAKTIEEKDENGFDDGG